MMNRTAWCLGLLAVLAAACSKQEPPARTAPADPPGPTASAASAKITRILSLFDFV